MVYDFNNPIFEFHQFHRHQCETSGICPMRQLVDVVGFPYQLADSICILPVQPGYDLCRNNCLPDIFTDAHPGFPGSLPDGVLLQLGQLRTDYLFLLFRPFLCRTTARLVLYLFHAFLLLNDVLEIATNGSGFLCGEQSKVVSVYRNITLLSL